MDKDICWQNIMLWMPECISGYTDSANEQAMDIPFIKMKRSKIVKAGIALIA